MASSLSIQPSSCDRNSVQSDEENLAKKQIQKMVLRRGNGGVDKAASRTHIMSLLKKFPKLAAETYKLAAELYHLCDGKRERTYILFIFVECGACLKHVKDIYNLYPGALTAPAEDGNDSGHPIVDTLKSSSARGSTFNSIAFLVQKYPNILKIRDEDDWYPIHFLFERQVEGIDRQSFFKLANFMLQSNPASCNHELLDLSRSPRIPKEFADFILQTFLKQDNVVSVGIVGCSGYALAVEEIIKIRPLFPKLQNLTCRPHDGYENKEAFNHITEAVTSHAIQLRKLYLDLHLDIYHKDRQWIRLIMAKKQLDEIGLRFCDMYTRDEKDFDAIARGLASRTKPLDRLKLTNLWLGRPSAFALLLFSENGSKNIALENFRLSEGVLLNEPDGSKACSACLEGFELSLFCQSWHYVTSTSTAIAFASGTLKHLGAIRSLRRLEFKDTNSTIFNFYSPLEALFAFLIGEKRNVTEEVFTILKNAPQLENISLPPIFRVDFGRAPATLQVNTHLRHFYVYPLVRSSHELLDQLRAMAGLMETRSCALESCFFSSYDGNYSLACVLRVDDFTTDIHLQMDKISFHCKLNRYGIKTILDPATSKKTFVDLLISAMKEDQRDSYKKDDTTVQVVYALLRENPPLWTNHVPMPAAPMTSFENSKADGGSASSTRKRRRVS